MTLDLLFRLIFNPRLLLTDVRSAHAGFLSLFMLLASSATFALANTLMFCQNPNLAPWLLRSVVLFLSFSAFGFFYLPLVHLLAEERSPQSTVMDLLAYAGFSVSPLFLTLPLSLILLLVPFGDGAYMALIIVVFVRILFILLEGIKEHYQLTTLGQASRFFFSPTLYILFFVLAIAFTASVLASYG